MTADTALYSIAEIRAIEQAAMAELPPGTLMQRAGQAAAEIALQLITDSRPTHSKVLILAGPGNNGGDALEVASRLADAGISVFITLFAVSEKYSLEAQYALARAQCSGAQFIDLERLDLTLERDWSLVVDGLFGIGLTRPISSVLRTIIERINNLSCPVLALDVPSGLDADTGNYIGNNGLSVRATHTITFIGNKPGLHTCFGRDVAGQVNVASLGIEQKFFRPTRTCLNHIDLFSQALHRRSHNTHKGSYGNILIVGGAHGMQGAPILAARAAAYCGVGRVYVGFVEEAPAYDSLHPELMCRIVSDLDFSAGTLVVGPGLGTSVRAGDIVQEALQTTSPLVLDADALNLIARRSDLQRLLSERHAPTTITPHPLEAARLLGVEISHIQGDRLSNARKLAQQFNVIAVLKGSGTVIADPSGNVVINPTGNPALATAGTGDVLAGVCGALIAQGWSAWHAALASTWLHGNAADVFVVQEQGPIGMTASELIPRIRTLLNRLINEYTQRSTSH